MDNAVSQAGQLAEEVEQLVPTGRYCHEARPRIQTHPVGLTTSTDRRGPLIARRQAGGHGGRDLQAGGPCPKTYIQRRRRRNWSALAASPTAAILRRVSDGVSGRRFAGLEVETTLVDAATPGMTTCFYR